VIWRTICAGRSTNERHPGSQRHPPALSLRASSSWRPARSTGGIEELDSAKGNLRGQIVIGAMQLAGSFLLASVLNEFIAAHPHATLRIWNGSSGAMLKSLRGGDVDIVIGLLRDPVPEDLVQEPLAEAPYVIAARQGHPLLRKKKVTLDDLAACDWVVGTPGACRRICFDALFAGRRRPIARVETSSLPTIRLVLARSDCLTLFTSYELMYEGDALAAVPYGPIEPVPSIGVTTRAGWLPTQLQVNFLRLIRKQMTTSLTPGEGAAESKLSARLDISGRRGDGSLAAIMRRTTVFDEDVASPAATCRAAPAQNLSTRRQNQSPGRGARRENPLRKMMLRPVTGVRNNNETDCDGSFTGAPRTLRETLESPFSFRRHRSAASAPTELRL